MAHLANTPVPRDRHNIQLHAVASRQHGSLLNVGVAAELFDGSGPLCLWHSQLLSQLYWCIVHRQSHRNNGALLLPSVACGGRQVVFYAEVPASVWPQHKLTVYG